MGRILIFVGLTLLFSGILFHFGERFGIGNLPGDITLKGDQYLLKIPLMTCLLISAVLSVVAWLWRKFS